VRRKCCICPGGIFQCFRIRGKGNKRLLPYCQCSQERPVGSPRGTEQQEPGKGLPARQPQGIHGCRHDLYRGLYPRGDDRGQAGAAQHRAVENRRTKKAAPARAAFFLVTCSSGVVLCSCWRGVAARLSHRHLHAAQPDHHTNDDNADQSHCCPGVGPGITVTAAGIGIAHADSPVRLRDRRPF